MTEPPPPSTLIPPAALETDPNSPSNLRAITPEQQPIIDAYLKGEQASLLTYSEWPLNPDHPRLRTAPLTDNWRENAVRAGFVRRAALNQVLDISGGVTFRPFVAAEYAEGGNAYAVVWDCQISAVYWKDVDTGDKAPPDYWPNAGPPGVEVGYALVLVQVDGQWLLDADGGVEPRACD